MQRGYVYMLRFRKKDSKELIKRMAKTNGCSVSEIRREMQYAIDEARNSDDPNKQAEFQRFGFCSIKFTGQEINLLFQEPDLLFQFFDMIFILLFRS